MNHVEEFCRMLGVEVNEPFRVEEWTKNKWIRILENGRVEWSDDDRKSFGEDRVLFSHLLIGKLTPKKEVRELTVQEEIEELKKRVEILERSVPFSPFIYPGPSPINPLTDKWTCKCK